MVVKVKKADLRLTASGLGYIIADKYDLNRHHQIPNMVHSSSSVIRFVANALEAS